MKNPRENRPAPYLNRRDQYRMLAMVGLLCLVMVAIKFAALPESWYWILPPAAEGGKETIRIEELDFRVKQDAHEPLPPDVFRAVADVSQADSGMGADDADSPADRQQPASVDVNADLLSAIEDNTLGVRRAEVDAYHLMLDRIRKLPEEAIDAAARDDVAFTVIMLQSGEYRGQIVAITGQLRRLTEYPVMENGRGIDRLYEGWVFTNDSENNPWRFLCTELPAEMELGEEIDPVKVQLAGYFFKRSGYLSQGGQHVAPTLLAKTFRIVPTPTSVAPEMPAQLRSGILGFVGLIFAALAILAVRLFWGDRTFAKSRLGELAAARLDAAPEDLEALKELETIDPSTRFEQTASADGTADGDSTGSGSTGSGSTGSGSR